MPSSEFGIFELDGTAYSTRLAMLRPNYSRAGVRLKVWDDVALRRLITIQKRATDDPETMQHYRKLWQQIFDFRFERASLEFADQIRSLNKGGLPIIVRANDLMSRQDTRCYQVSSSIPAYYTPTWPIRPPGWVTGDAQVWDDAVHVNGASTILPYAIYPETGTILFEDPLLVTDIVTCSYEWMISALVDQNLRIENEDDRYNLHTIEGAFIQDVPVGWEIAHTPPPPPIVYECLQAWWSFEDGLTDAIGSKDWIDAGTVGSDTGVFGLNAKFTGRTEGRNEGLLHDGAELAIGDQPIAFVIHVTPSANEDFDFLNLVASFDEDLNFEYQVAIFPWDDDGMGNWTTWGAYFWFPGGGAYLEDDTNLLSVGVAHQIKAWLDPTTNEIFLQIDDNTPISDVTSDPFDASIGTRFEVGNIYSGEDSGGLIGPISRFESVLSSGDRTALWNSGAFLPYSGYAGAGLTASFHWHMSEVNGTRFGTVGGVDLVEHRAVTYAPGLITQGARFDPRLATRLYQDGDGLFNPGMDSFMVVASIKKESLETNFNGAVLISRGNSNYLSGSVDYQLGIDDDGFPWFGVSIDFGVFNSTQYLNTFDSAWNIGEDVNRILVAWYDADDQTLNMQIDFETPLSEALAHARAIYGTGYQIFVGSDMYSSAHGTAWVQDCMGFFDCLLTEEERADLVTKLMDGTDYPFS